MSHSRIYKIPMEANSSCPLPNMNCNIQAWSCHAERSEASFLMGTEMLRCAQHDKTFPNRPLRSPHKKAQGGDAGQAEAKPARDHQVRDGHQDDASCQSSSEHESPGKAANARLISIAIAIAVISSSSTASRSAVRRTSGELDFDLARFEFGDNSLQ